VKSDAAADNLGAVAADLEAGRTLSSPPATTSWTADGARHSLGVRRRRHPLGNIGGDTLEGESGAVVLGSDLLGIEAAERL
jgi:hypothetical protein